MEERIYSTFISTVLLIIERSQDKNATDQNLEAGADVEAQECCCLLVCSTCFLIEPRITSPEISPSTMTWVFPYQTLIKKMSFKMAYISVLWRLLLNLDSLISKAFSLCQVDIKLSAQGKIGRGTSGYM